MTTPRITIAGPTLDNAYPDASGCHILWISVARVEATVERVDVTQATGPAPSAGTSPEPTVDRVSVDAIRCGNIERDQPPPVDGCRVGVVISAAQSCGVRPTIGLPTLPGSYTARLVLSLSTLCRDRANALCAAITSPYPPSTARPLTAAWSVECAIAVTVVDDPATGERTDQRDLTDCAVRQP